MLLYELNGRTVTGPSTGSAPQIRPERLMRCELRAALAALATLADCPHHPLNPPPPHCRAPSPAPFEPPPLRRAPKILHSSPTWRRQEPRLAPLLGGDRVAYLVDLFELSQ